MFTRELAEYDIPAVNIPLMEITALATALPDLSTSAAIAFTSANGVRSFATKTDRRGVPAYAVGPATKAECEKYGLKIAGMADNNVESLATLIAKDAPFAGNILHIAGSHRKGDLKTALAENGISCERVVLYEAVAVAELPSAMHEKISEGAFDMIAFFSPRTTDLFLALCDRAKLPEDALKRLTYVCLSQAVAKPLRERGFSAIRVAKTPHRQAMIDIIISDST
jgi:uroporphyrinogen-III synthase